MYLVHGRNKYYLRSLFIMIMLLVLALAGTAQAAASGIEGTSNIELSSSRDEYGIRITMHSGMTLNPEIITSNSQVIYKFAGCQLIGQNYLKEVVGKYSLIISANSDAQGTTVVFKLPANLKYNNLLEDDGKSAVFYVPNAILDLQTYPNDSGAKIVLSTICPVKYTSAQTDDLLQVTLYNISQGQAKYKYTVNNSYLDTIKLASTSSDDSGIILNIATHNVKSVSYGVSGANNDMNIILTKQTQQQQQTIAPVTYSVIQEYICHNRPGTALTPVGQVVHATASPGSTAQNIRDYFNNHSNAYASTHAVIDWNSIIEMIPENEMAWHAGPTANKRYLSFEMCQPAENDPNRFNEFQEVWNRAVWYCAKTCIKYGWNTTDNIFSHYGISQTYHETNHTDPYGYFSEYGKTWADFLYAVNTKITELNAASY